MKVKHLFWALFFVFVSAWIGLSVWAGDFDIVRPGDCYTYKPSGNPFEPDQPMHKCVIAVQGGWVQYYFITNYAGRWRCDVSTDKAHWFTGPYLMKTEHKASQFCASLRNVEGKTHAAAD